MSKRKATEKRDPEDVEMASHEEDEEDSGSDGEVTLITFLNVHTPCFLFFQDRYTPAPGKLLSKAAVGEWQLTFQAERTDEEIHQCTGNQATSQNQRLLYPNPFFSFFFHSLV